MGLPRSVMGPRVRCRFASERSPRTEHGHCAWTALAHPESGGARCGVLAGVRRVVEDRSRPRQLSRVPRYRGAGLSADPTGCAGRGCFNSSQRGVDPIDSFSDRALLPISSLIGQTIAFGPALLVMLVTVMLTGEAPTLRWFVFPLSSGCAGWLQCRFWARCRPTGRIAQGSAADSSASLQDYLLHVRGAVFR